MTKLPRSATLLIAALVLIIAVPVFAGDPPDRVMRLKYMSGQVSFQPGGVDDWVAATMNRPLTTADRVWTDKESRAELKLAAAALRMDSETSMTISNLSDNTVQIELDQGVLNVHVRRMAGGEIYEVDTPNVAFTLLKPGDYRFEVDPTSDTSTVIVRHGKGEANGNGRGVRVESGELAHFEHGNTMMHSTAQAPRPDGFDDWCRVRDDREDKAESVRYVSDDVIGYEDLDEYGYWRPAPTYGYVWVPRTVVVGWAPYRYGHWAFIEPWGWTWVDDAPWGFAPFHYGRWVYSSYGWAWCPGPRHIHPVYAPALVAWFGGPHWGVGLSFGGPAVGWVPLGWGEPYYPYYRVSPGYVRNVNISSTHITNVTYVTNNYNTIINNRGPQTQLANVRYVNQEHGVTAVSTGVLQHGRPVARETVTVSERDFAGGHFMHNADVAPTRASVLDGRENLPATIPPRGVMNRPIVSKMMPPERPASFESRAPYIERNRGMAVDPETMSNLRRTAPENNAGMAPKQARPEGSSEMSRPNSELNRPPVNVIARPNAPEENKPANAGVGRPDNVGRPDSIGRSENLNPAPVNAPGHLVPRPPERSPRVINLDGSGDSAVKEERGTSRSAGEANNASGTQHYVPRPPSERRAVSGTEVSPGTPARDESRIAPENRTSPVFDRRESNNPGPSSVEAEASSPRNGPRPLEQNSPANENRASDQAERRSVHENAEHPATQDNAGRRSIQDNLERRSAPENHSAPRPERQQPNEERRSSPPPSEKPKSEPPQKTSMRYVPSPRNQSYSPRGSAYSTGDGYASARSSHAPRTQSYSKRYESYAPRYERSSMSYSRPSYSPSSSYSGSHARPVAPRSSYAHSAAVSSGHSSPQAGTASTTHSSRAR
jgi:hypothetical protein